jgi:hypothetical protein
MFLPTVIQQIFFAEISSPSDSTATWNITRKSAFVVLVTHMFRVRGLGIEGLILSLRLSRKLLECLVAVLGTSMVWAYRKGIFKARFGTSVRIFHLQVMIIADMLLQVIQTPESIGTSVKLAVCTRILGIVAAEGFKMPIEDIESREQRPAFTSIRLMLCLFGMPK